MSDDSFTAVIFDLDGVITRTADLHAQAWKEMFDRYLERRGEEHEEGYEPFDLRGDYDTYVDGKPRYEGVASFLASRGVELPEGEEEDGVEEETVYGLGNRKNEIFHELLEEEGVSAYGDAVEQIRKWREAGLKTAVVSSSRNCVPVLEAVGIRNLFDVKVDGVDAERMGLPGKPAPDTFLEAARQLDVKPTEAALFEDAQAGVQAGRRGGFRLVVGVARNGDEEELRAHGADVAVDDLRDVAPWISGELALPRARRSALGHWPEIERRLTGRQLALFFDYDGTLTPIVDRPENATLSDEMRELLQRLAARHPVSVVSGRDLADVRGMVDLDRVYYAGSHGFDIAGPGGMRMQNEEAQEALPELEAAEEKLHERLDEVEGARVERKAFAIAVHYRQVAEADESRVEEAAREVAAERETLRLGSGKKIYELQPDVAWNKGAALRWLMEELDLGGAYPLYLGDDTTDEDAFEVLRGWGLGIRVGAEDEPTAAQYLLRDVSEVAQLLRLLLRRQ